MSVQNDKMVHFLGSASIHNGTGRHDSSWNFVSDMTDARKIALFNCIHIDMIRDHFRKIKEEFLEETARMREILREDGAQQEEGGRPGR